MKKPGRREGTARAVSVRVAIVRRIVGVGVVARTGVMGEVEMMIEMIKVIGDR